MDADRLARSDRHFARYVDDGRLAGWQAVVTRRSKIVPSVRSASATPRPACRWPRDTLWRITRCTADHLGGRDDPCRGGLIELTTRSAGSSRSRRDPGST